MSEIVAGLWPNPLSQHHLYWLGLLSEGLKRHGVRVKIIQEERPQTIEADFVAVWGWRMASKVSGVPVLVCEHGYLGERMTEWMSLGWGGLNGRADFCNADVPGDRAKHWLRSLKPCRPFGAGPVVVMGQVGGDASWGNVSPESWYKHVVGALRRAGHEIRFRPHPKHPQYQPGVFRREDIFRGSLDDVLGEASGIVTFSSNSGVDAVLAGAPTIAWDEGSMVYGLVPSDLPFRTIDEVARLRWLELTAYCQWSISEIENGTAWEHVKKGL